MAALTVSAGDRVGRHGRPRGVSRWWERRRSRHDSIFRFNATEGDTITLSLDINSGEASGFRLSPIENGTPRSNPLRTEVISESDEFEITAPETREYWLSIGSGTVDVTVTVGSAE